MFYVFDHSFIYQIFINNHDSLFNFYSESFILDQFHQKMNTTTSFKRVLLSKFHGNCSKMKTNSIVFCTLL